MANRRVPKDLKLKLASPTAAAAEVARDATVGGLGLDFADVPDVLDAAGAAEWSRLGEVFARDATRFREGDRAAVTCYCAFWSAFAAAAADVAGNGPVTAGRSAKDRGRLVKNPATVAMRESATQLRYWARELGLTPDARGRIGLDGGAADPDDEDNPFAPGYVQPPGPVLNPFGDGVAPRELLNDNDDAPS